MLKKFIMSDILEQPIVLSIFGGIIALVALYLNNKIYKKENNRVEYLKVFFLVFVIIFLILNIFIMNKDGSGQSGGYSANYGNLEFDIKGGNPDF